MTTSTSTRNYPSWIVWSLLALGLTAGSIPVYPHNESWPLLYGTLIGLHLATLTLGIIGLAKDTP